MPNQLSTLFAGVTTSPAREFVASLSNRKTTKRVVLPCVGRWAVATAVAKEVPANRIEASDLCLFSTVIGYLADPRHSIEELNLTVPERYQRFVMSPKDDIDYAAGVLLVLKFISTPGKNRFLQDFRRELWARSAEHREALRVNLAEQVEVMKGCRYDVLDCREVIKRFADDGEAGDLGYANLPGYRGGYGKQYGAAEAELWPEGQSLLVSEFDPKEAKPTLDLLTGKPPLFLAYIHHGDEQMPDAGWEKLAAIESSGGRVDYIVANHDPGKRLTHTNLDLGEGERWPVYADQDITPESEIAFHIVDKHTCLRYRDLFVHRLGQTRAEIYILMTIDGRVVTACGLHIRDVTSHKQDHVSEVFGVSITSKRYKRLGKLFMLCLTSYEFYRWLTTVKPDLQSQEILGIQTASPTQHAEGKTDRSVLKLVKRVKQPNGDYQLLYRGKWRDDTFADVLALWCEKWGEHSRGAAPVQQAKTGRAARKRARLQAEGTES
jgi:hypothetical protein